MFSEYAAVSGGGLGDWWTGKVLPILNMISDLPYFWPGVVAAALLFILVTKKIFK